MAYTSSQTSSTAHSIWGEISCVTIFGTMEILPAAEGYEFHMRNVSDVTPSQYYGLVYQSGIPYTGSSGQVTVNFTRGVYEATYEYVSVPIIAERFPVGNYEMNIYSDAGLTTEVGSTDFTINPMVHITQPGLHDSTIIQDITIAGYISNYTALDSLNSLRLVLNGTSLDINSSSYLDLSTGEFSVPVSLQEGNNRFEVSMAYTSSQTSSTAHSIWGGISYIIDECFIATAAYGSKYQPDVVLLRQFRDNYLMTNHVGQAFVKFYYRYSPPIAHFIAENYLLKIVVRTLLTPFVAIAYLLIHSIIMSAVLVLFIMVAIWMRRRKKSMVGV
jgi:hypothetical protein